MSTLTAPLGSRLPDREECSVPTAVAFTEAETSGKKQQLLSVCVCVCVCVCVLLALFQILAGKQGVGRSMSKDLSFMRVCVG